MKEKDKISSILHKFRLNFRVVFGLKMGDCKRVNII